MRKKFIGAFTLLIVGVALVGVGVQSNLMLGADTSNSFEYDNIIRISIYIGVALIAASGVLFAIASGANSK